MIFMIKDDQFDMKNLFWIYLSSKVKILCHKSLVTQNLEKFYPTIEQSEEASKWHARWAASILYE